MMKKNKQHDVCSLFKSGISRTHKVLAASVVLAAGLLYGCSDSEVNEGEDPNPDPTPVESGIETQAIKVNNNSADFADRITLYGEGAESRAATDGEKTDKVIIRELALVAPPKAIGGVESDQNLSATCVVPTADYDKVYVCYHLNTGYKDNEEGLTSKSAFQGAVELIRYYENATADRIVTSQLINNDQDFNYCTIVGDMLYTIGDMNAGARLGRIPLLNDVFIDAKGMKTFKLKGGSGNCVVEHYPGELLIATNKGFYKAETEDLNDEWKVDKLDSIPTIGSAKFIATQDLDDDVVTLHLENVTPLPDSDENIARAVIQNGWKDPKWTKRDYEITPTDGKNTVAFGKEAGVVYVCLGENGVVKLDAKSGEKLGEYCLTKDRPDYKGKACANGVVVDENYVYIAYGGYGLVVLEKDNMKRVARYAHKETVKDADGNETVKAIYSANYVALADGLIYVAYGRNGLGILKLDTESVEK